MSLFTGAPLRGAVADGRADFVPVFLSDIPRLFASEAIKPDVAILQLSPPDKHGLCTLGTSCDTARAAADSAGLILAEINERMPRTHGATAVRLDRVAAFARTDRPLPEHAAEAESPEVGRIGEQVTGLIEDGSCLQMGTGAIPNTVLARLTGKSDLGIHTEMFSDGVVGLYESGAITNRLKAVHPGRIVTSFVNGSRKVVRLRGRQPGGRVPPVRPDQRHRPDPQERQGGSDQLGDPARPDRAKSTHVRRSDQSTPSRRPAPTADHRRPVARPSEPGVNLAIEITTAAGCSRRYVLAP